MIFTATQLAVLIVVSELMAYAAIAKVMDTIKHCATARAYGKLRTNGYLVKMEDLEAKINQEEKKDGEK